MAAGRPTKYKPEYCEAVIEVGKRGGSVVEMAVECDVDKRTLYEWNNTIQEFSHAFTHARNQSQIWWEQLGQRCMVMKQGAGTFSQAAWSRSMAARFPEDWRESKHTELTGKDGGDIGIDVAFTVNVIDPKHGD